MEYTAWVALAGIIGIWLGLIVLVIWAHMMGWWAFSDEVEPPRKNLGRKEDD